MILDELVYYEYKGYLLECTPRFSQATKEERAEVCNGMGPEGLGWLVPDTMYFVDVSPAGDVHDYMYEYPDGMTRLQCDKVFLRNMLRIIEKTGGWSWVQWLRRRRALKYYWAVRKSGGHYFE